MITVLGHRGMLGSVVERRWRELGASGDYVVVCLTPDNLPFLRRLAGPGVIVPSTDAIAEDSEYAATKREIEAIPGLVIIRAGIIDTRKVYPVGFTDWLCNPVTPLEWADAAWALRDTPGVHEVGRRDPSNRFQVAWNTAAIFHQPDRPAPGFGGSRDRTVRGTITTPLITAIAAYRDWLG